MKRSDPNWDEYTVIESLRSLHFSLCRFEMRRDVDDLDCAERHAEAVRPYLPEAFQELNLGGLNNLYLGSPPLHGRCAVCREIKDQSDEVEQ